MNIPARSKPAYLVISDALRGRIERQELRPGDRFPTERELVQEFGVARMTVRHALDILQLEGLIDRKRGRTGGTFVRAIPPVLSLTSLTTVVTQLDSRGYDMDAKVFDVSKTAASRPVAAALEVDEGTDVWMIRRVRSVDGTPVLYSVHYIPVELFPDLDKADLTVPLYELLEENNGQAPVFKREVVTPITPGTEEQEHLGVPRNQPLLRLSRTDKSASGNVVGYTEESLRADLANVEVVVGEEPTPSDPADPIH